MLSSFSPQVLEWLASHRHEDPLSVILRTSPFEEVSSATLAAQIAGMRVAVAKYPHLLQYPQYRYPPKTSLEQSSSAVTAEYKATLLSGRKVVDLCGGMGIDAMTFSAKGYEVTYVEKSELLCELCRYNAKVLGHKVDVICTSAEQYLAKATPYDTVYIDPSRRVEGNKKTGIKKLLPNVVELQHELLAISKSVLIKLSPMQDISEAIAEIRHIARVHVVAVQEDVKELLLEIREGYEGPTELAAVILGGKEVDSYTASIDQARDQLATNDVGLYLYQPHPAIVKAGLHNHQAATLGLYKVQANTQLYTGGSYELDYQGRVYKVLDKVPLQKKAVRKYLPDQRAHIVSKNHPLSSDQIAKKLGVQEGTGPSILAMTIYDGSRAAYLCERLK